MKRPPTYGGGTVRADQPSVARTEWATNTADLQMPLASTWYSNALFDVQSENPQKWALQIADTEYAQASSPARNPENCWMGGGSDPEGVADTVSNYVGLSLVYGVGNTNMRVFMDYIPGTYEIPMAQSVRVVAWGRRTTYFTSYETLKVGASITPGGVSFPRPPTLTANYNITAGVPAILQLRPPKARAFDVYCADPAAVVTVTGSRLLVIRDNATPAAFPPWTPVEYADEGIPTGGGNIQIAVSGVVSANVLVRYTLGL